MKYHRGATHTHTKREEAKNNKYFLEGRKKGVDDDRLYNIAADTNGYNKTTSICYDDDVYGKAYQTSTKKDNLYFAFCLAYTLQHIHHDSILNHRKIDFDP